MNSSASRYHRHRLPPKIISHAVGLYHRFSLSFRDIEDLLADRGVIVSHETVRQWCQKFGLDYARDLQRRLGRRGDIWHLDELFVNIRGTRHYLWRAVDQDGDVIDILIQRCRVERSVRADPARAPVPPAHPTPTKDHRKLDQSVAVGVCGDRRDTVDVRHLIAVQQVAKRPRS